MPTPLSRLLMNRTSPVLSLRSLFRISVTPVSSRRFASSMPGPPQLQNVALSVDSGSIAILKYNRPKNANALNVATLKDVLAGLKWAEADDSIRVIVTTGEGRFYTAGLDLLDKSNHGPNSTISDEFIGYLGNIHEVLINTSKLVISAVNGPAPGWGTSSLALSDLVYATPEAIFFTPFVQWGLSAEGCSSLTFARIMGRQKASSLLLAGERMTAAELEAAGLVTKVLPAEGFVDAVLGVARRASKLPPKALGINKDLMMQLWRKDLLEANKRELALLSKQAHGKESKDAIEGFAREQEQKKKKAKL